MKRHLYSLMILSLVLAFASTGTANADVVGFWTFDNVDGVGFSDLSNSGLTGVLGKPFSEVESIAGVSGADGDFAIRLDGDSGLFIDDSANKFGDIQPPITLEAWVRSDLQQDGNYGLIAYGIPGGRTGGGGWKLGLNGGNLRFTTFAVVDVNSQVAFPFDGEWHHVAATYSLEFGEVTFYMDGFLEEVVAESRDITTPGAFEMNIGTEFNAISRFTGDIDRARVSTAVFEEGQLDSNPTEVLPPGDNTLFYYDFDEGQPPYTSEGQTPAPEAVSLTTWITNNLPRENTNTPLLEEIGPTGEAGDFALTYELDANDQAFVADPDGLLDFSDGDWTLEAWVSTDLFFDTTRAVLFYYGRPGEGYSLSINDDGRLQVTTLGIKDADSTGAMVPSNFEWTHVAVSHVAGQTLNYFINGELIESNDYTGLTNPANGGILYIGSEPGGTLPYLGSIDRIRISNTALSAEELDSDPAVINIPVGVSDWAVF